MIRRRHPLKAEINVVPYIDVMLVLLVIFMITAPLLNQSVEVDLPKATASPLQVQEKELEAVVLSVRKDGNCLISIGAQKAKPTHCQQLTPQRSDIAAHLRQTPPPPVLVRADKDLRYEQVIQAMIALKGAGAAKVGLSTAPPDAPARR